MAEAAPANNEESAMLSVDVLELLALCYSIPLATIFPMVLPNTVG